MTLLSSGNYLDGRTFDTSPRFNRGEGGNKTRIAKVLFFFLFLRRIRSISSIAELIIPNFSSILIR